MKNYFNIGRHVLVLLAVYLASSHLSAQVTFQRTYSSPVEQSSRDVLPTPDGGYLIVGMTKPNPYDTNLLIMKTNWTGDTVWTKTYGGTGQEYPYVLQPTPEGNYLIIGYTSSYGAGGYDAWLLKIDPSGNIIWTKTYGGPQDDLGKGMVPTNDGNYVIVGETKSHSPGNSDDFLTKVDPSGNIIWTQYYGGSQFEGAHCLAQCPDGGYVFCGQTWSSGAGMGDIWLVKTDAGGNTQWSQTYGGAGTDDGNWVLANADGSIIICAETNSAGAGDYDVQAIKTNATGGVIWNQLYGGDKKDVSKMIQPTNDGGYVIAAISRSFGWINPDMWMVKIDGSGNQMWTTHYGSWDHEHCYAIKQMSDGAYIVLGHTRSGVPVTEIEFLRVNGNGALATAPALLASHTLQVYPNPSEGIIHLDIRTPGTGNTQLRISNAMGQVMMQEKIEPAEMMKTVDLNERGPGIYFVSLSTDEHITTQKVIVK